MFCTGYTQYSHAQCQFWLFTGQCKSVAYQQKLLYIFGSKVGICMGVRFKINNCIWCAHCTLNSVLCCQCAHCIRRRRMLFDVQCIYLFIPVIPITFLLTNPTQTRFALGSHLDRQWSPPHGYISVSFCTAYIIVTFRAKVRVSFMVG